MIVARGGLELSTRQQIRTATVLGSTQLAKRLSSMDAAFWDARVARTASMRILAAMIMAVSLFPRHAQAQPMLDTGRTTLGTRVVRTIGPSKTDNWEFVRTRSLEVDRLGQMWILDDTDHRIRVFSSDGRLLKTLGGDGSGPGEFRRPRWIQRLGDTIWAYDPSAGRLSPFSVATLKLLRASRPDVPHMFTQAVSPVGLFIAALSSYDEPGPSNPVTTTFTHEFSATKQQRVFGKRTTTQGGIEARMYNPAKGPPPPQARGGGMHAPQPFDTTVLYKVGSNGRSFVFVERSDGRAASANPLTVTRADAPLRIIEVGFKGDTLFDRRYSTPAAPLTPAQVNAVVDSLSTYISKLVGLKTIGSTSDIRETLMAPKRWPAITEFYVGIDGTFWLLQPAPPGRVSKFWRLAADGNVLPSVSVNAGLRILRVSANRIWVALQDGSGFETIQIHDVVPLKQ